MNFTFSKTEKSRYFNKSINGMVGRDKKNPIQDKTRISIFLNSQDKTYQEIARQIRDKTRLLMAQNFKTRRDKTAILVKK